MRIGSLFTGYGGLDHAVQAVFGGELAWWCDNEPGPIAVMERHHPGVPNLGDLKTVDWQSVAPVDILTGGYPCQPFSNAGKRLGTDDPRHLWPYLADAVRLLRPRLVVLENVAAHLRRGFDVVLADLAEIGYDARWTVVRASDAGAPHRRERLFVVAYPARQRDDGGWATRPRRRDEHSDGDQPAADRESVGRDERQTEHAGLQWGPGAADDRGARLARWGDYAGAIERWERILGRAAPEPTVTGARGARVLSPYLTEWMMGLPEGHITGTPGLSRNQMIKLAGNGVVPQQAERALRELW